MYFYSIITRLGDRIYENVLITVNLALAKYKANLNFEFRGYNCNTTREGNLVILENRGDIFAYWGILVNGQQAFGKKNAVKPTRR